MAPAEISLPWIAGRMSFQNPYRHQRCSAARIYGLRLYATAPQYGPGLLPKQKPGTPNQNSAVRKPKPPPLNLNRFISPTVPEKDKTISPNTTKENKYVSPNTSKKSLTPPKYKSLVQRRSRGTLFDEPITAPKPPSAFESKTRGLKSKARIHLPRVRIVIGVLFVGSLIYSMFTSPLQTEGATALDRDNVFQHESGIRSDSNMRLRMEEFVKSKQSEIVAALESLDPSHKFRTDRWTREAGGEGISRVLQDGKVFEKAGVNTSIVYGTLPRPAIEKMRANHKAIAPNVESLEFFAAGLSLVLHPQNPMVPTVHLNYRYFEAKDSEGKCIAWFGGGTDLTPSYLFDEDVIHFHRTIKDACDKHDRDYYPRFKEWCDRYFRIPHRDESRGVGGIFFDDLDTTEKDEEQLFAFIKDCTSAFLPSYIPIVQKRKDMTFTDQEREWQQLRRGRYVEFNLVTDRGTQFGLQTPGARVESILMSLPLTARWMYMHEPGKGSREERLLGVLKKPVDWV